MGKLSARCPGFGLIMAGVIELAVPGTLLAHTHTRSQPHHHARPNKRKVEPVHNDKTKPAGVTTIPAGGLKVYCARKSPLLIRKSTQGNGTTVTVICR